MSSYSRCQLESWLKRIDVKADRVLDVGGSQLSIKGRTKSWEVGECKVLDLPEPHEVKQKPDLITDLNIDWKTKEVLEEAEVSFLGYDTVFCIEVSEYWWNPFQALENIALYTKKNGKLYISFHFIYPVHNPKKQDYLRYTEFGVRKLLKETGFEVEEMIYRTANYPEHLRNWFGIEKMRPSKNYKFHNVVGCLVQAKKI